MSAKERVHHVCHFTKVLFISFILQTLCVFSWKRRGEEREKERQKEGGKRENGREREIEEGRERERGIRLYIYKIQVEGKFEMYNYTTSSGSIFPKQTLRAAH